MDGQRSARQAESDDTASVARRRATSIVEASAPPTRYAQLGLPPEDTIGANAWMHRVLTVSAVQTITDPTITEVARRQMLCDIAARMVGLTPQAKLNEAVGKLRAGPSGVLGDGGPAMEPANVVEVPEGIGIPTGGSPARRGRPRKRAIR